MSKKITHNLDAGRVNPAGETAGAARRWTCPPDRRPPFPGRARQRQS